MTKSHRIVISGSFRKHFEGISQTVRLFESQDIEVLSPKASTIKNPGAEFAVLESDTTSDPQLLEQQHLDAIMEADALYLYNPDGYLGTSTALELGWAHAQGKPIYCKEPITDVALRYFGGTVATPEQVQIALANRSPVEAIQTRTSLPALQHYIHAMVIRRGFNNEGPRDVFHLLVEEVGELAKAMRKSIGLKIDTATESKYPQIRQEMADIFIYLLDLANLFHVSLIDALKEKEIENEKRTWN